MPRKQKAEAGHALPPAEEAPAETPAAEPLTDFPVVGIGASAGGLAAFEAFFSGMPADTDPGMAFVLVQHLALDHKRSLSELVRRYTRMEVYEVEDGMHVRPNTTTVLSSGQVSDRPETLDRKVSKGCESTGFEETCRSGERRGQETLAEHGEVRGLTQGTSAAPRSPANSERQQALPDVHVGQAVGALPDALHQRLVTGDLG